MASRPCCYCEKCKSNNKTINNKSQNYYINKGVVTFYDGFLGLGACTLPRDVCPECGTKLIKMNINTDEWNIVQKTTTDTTVLFALDKLKADDPIEFALKMAQFKQTAETIKQTKIAEEEQKSNLATLKASQKNADKPKCPTCGSTNIKKISGTKRWVTTGMFGLGSSNVGKTMQCNSCGYKW